MHALLLAVLLSVPAASVQASDRRPDVMIFLVDEVGWKDFNQVATPNLDGLAARGLTYRRFYVMPACSPTRYALMFGRLGRRDAATAVIASYLPPAADNPTPSHDLLSLPKVMKAAGYHTALFGKWHIGSNSLLAPFQTTPHLHGFDVFRAGAMSNLGAGSADADYFDWLRSDDGVVEFSQVYATTALRDETIRWWRETPGRKFAFVSFHAAHGPYHDPPPEALPPGWPLADGRRGQFESMIASVDYTIGQILEHVDLERTLVIFLSDNGTPRGVDSGGGPFPPDPSDEGAHGKHTTFEGGIRVPLIVAGPRVARGESSFALVHAVDFLATLREYVGDGPIRGGAEDSVSFLETFLDPGWTGRRDWVFSEQYDSVGDKPFIRDDQAIVGPRFKLRIIEGEESLYDLALDPGEKSPIDVDDPDHRDAVRLLRYYLAKGVPPRKKLGNGPTGDVRRR